MAEASREVSFWDGDPKAEALDILAQAFADAKLYARRDIQKFARQYHLSEDDIARWKESPKMAKRVAEKIQVRAIHYVAEFLPQMAELAKTSVQAARFVSQVATVLPVGGVSFQSNTLIDARSSGQSDTSRAFARAYWQRVRRIPGGLELIEAIQQETPPTHIPDPTEPGGPVEPEPEPEPEPGTP